MNGDKGVVLPYRTTGDELTRFLDARARGRDLAQIQALDFSTGAFQGTLVAATALGFLDPESRELTDVGREYVLAGATERPTLLRGAIERFEPYGLLLEAVFDRGAPTETPLDWVVNWWGTHGFGNSETNRDEGASAFARMVEFSKLGSFVPGRRGHPTRIRWTGSAAGAPSGKARSARAEAAVERLAEEPPAAPPKAHTRPAVEAAPQPPAAATPARAAASQPGPAADVEPNTSLVLSLGPGRTVQLIVPPRITTAEKKRLLALLELIINPAAGD